jgi:hypothetical protein
VRIPVTHQLPEGVCMRVRRAFLASCFSFIAIPCALSQTSVPTAATLPATATAPPSTSPSTVPGGQSASGDKHAFGIIPNFRTVDASTPYKPISAKQKMAIAARDSIDWTLPIVAAGYAGLGQLTSQNKTFGQGMSGYGNRFVRSYADQVMGNMLVEGVMTSAFREDPRYFRLGQGTFWSRTWYAASRVFITRTDGGKTRFNYSETIGNSLAVGISNAYYPDTRNVGDNLQRLTIQIGTDAFTNILKEFWPDVKRKKSGNPPSP